jgi:hypothetical protein
MARQITDDQDPDAGSTFLKNHMSEAQPSRADGGFANKARNRNPVGSDGYYEQRYGKPTDLSPGDDQSVNRGAKGNRLR